MLFSNSITLFQYMKNADGSLNTRGISWNNGYCKFYCLTLRDLGKA